MRVDVFLKKLCIVKSRSVAAKLCHEGKITVNGRPAKSSKDIRIEDEISIVRGSEEFVFSVLALPEGNVSKALSPSFYRTIRLRQLPGSLD